jgi:Fur family ferric uptake transcriptional regulator
VADKEHHHHFHCRRCDKVFEIEDCPGSLRHLAPAGFQAERHEIILYGLCAGCASK